MQFYELLYFQVFHVCLYGIWVVTAHVYHTLCVHHNSTESKQNNSLVCLLLMHNILKGSRSSKKPVETGTQNKDDIDYQWLPKGSIPGTPSKITLLDNK